VAATEGEHAMKLQIARPYVEAMMDEFPSLVAFSDAAQASTGVVERKRPFCRVCDERNFSCILIKNNLLS
jgi:hypothetical protein